jgi:hypothetical protein
MIETPISSIGSSSSLIELNEEACVGSIGPSYQSVRKYGRYHRPIARRFLFWLNGDYARGK